MKKSLPLYRLYDKDSKRFLNGDFYIGVESGRVRGIYGEEFDNIVIQQCLGIVDKNNKPIFEGDFIKHRYSKENQNDYIVKIFEPIISFRLNNMDYQDWSQDEWFDTNKLEVIGNIFENENLFTNDN